MNKQFMSRSQWSLSQARAEMLRRGIPRKVIAPLLSLLRIVCNGIALEASPGSPGTLGGKSMGLF